MLKLTSIRSLAFLLTLLFTVCNANAGDLVLITQRDSDLDISSNHLKRLYFGKISSLPNGRKVTVLVYTKDDNQFQQFTRRYLGRTSQQLRSFWAKQLFTGRGSLPVRVDSPEEMIARVASSDEYVGYIAIEDLREPVKILELRSP